MRNTRILYLLLAAIIVATSCNKEEVKDYYSTIGIISITNDSIIITSDENNRLLVVNTSLGSTISDKDRVIAEFTMVNRTLPTGIDYVIEIVSIEKVLFKPVIELTAAITDSIGNDEIKVNELWLAKDYLNLNFSFYGGGVKHYINLTRNPGTIPTDTVDLEIRHNQKNDNQTYYLYSLVTFDLTTLQNNVADSVVLHITAKEYDNRTYSKFITYKY